ncbi:Hypothetical protein NGAL_HAMBI2605_45920 [Neorhizobium galegae bv. orientalis]|nr:Hypothetical protein NGAL_HAMBI2605_45920 [Neorhizobium galegae bv. orientalis]
MSAVLDFSDSRLGSWRDGQPEFGEDVVAVVSWRGKNTAYLFARDFWWEFIQWVSDLRHNEGDSRLLLFDEDDEEDEAVVTAQSYLESEDEHLERIGCRIIEITEWPIR